MCVCVCVCRYAGCSNAEVITRYLRGGEVQPQPDGCPDRIFELMKMCWYQDGSRRITFPQLLAELVAYAVNPPPDAPKKNKAAGPDNFEAMMDRLGCPDFDFDEYRSSDDLQDLLSAAVDV